MKTGIYLSGTIGLMSLFLFGNGAIAPSHADDYTSTQNSIRRDINLIHDDEARMMGLERKKADQMRHHDWRNARGTQRRILFTRNNIRREQEMLRADRHALDRLRHL